MLGLAAGGFPRTIEGWLDRIHPDDTERAMEARRGKHRDGAVQLRVPPAARRRALARVQRPGGPAHRPGRAPGEHDRRYAGRHARARRAGHGAARSRSCGSVLFRLPSPAMQVDERGAYIDADAHALSFFERSREEMLGATRARRLPCGGRRRSAPRTRRTARARGGVRVGAQEGLLLSVVPRASRAPRQLPARRRHHRAEEHAGGPGAVGARAAPSGDHPRRAQRGAQVLLEQREQDQRELEERIVSNIDQLIEPTSSA